MSKAVRRITLTLVLLSMIAMPIGSGGIAMGSDHNDGSDLATAGRQDARLTDLHGFIRNGYLVMSLCTDPTLIPRTVTKYNYPPDLTLRFNIDNNSAVTFDNATDLSTYGGTIVNPGAIKEDIIFEITFNENSEPRLGIYGMGDVKLSNVSLFVGMLDDPFLSQRWDTENRPAVVIQVPLSSVVKDQPTLLLWGTSKVPGFETPFQELAARQGRSQPTASNFLNRTHPSAVTAMYNVPPDVMILDTSRPVRYPEWPGTH